MSDAAITAFHPGDTHLHARAVRVALAAGSPPPLITCRIPTLLDGLTGDVFPPKHRLPSTVVASEGTTKGRRPDDTHRSRRAWDRDRVTRSVDVEMSGAETKAARETDRARASRPCNKVVVRHDPLVHTQLVASPVDLWAVAALVCNGTTQRAE